MKRAPELRDLSEDHHHALVLARRCEALGAEAGEEPGRDGGGARAAEEAWASVRAAFERALEPHFRIEEEHLLPALEAIGEPAMAARIQDDHAALRALVAEPPGAAALAAFGTKLRAHVRYEERVVFAATQDRLPPAALEAVAAATRARPRACATDFLP